jgi:hypothetical protein
MKTLGATLLVLSLQAVHALASSTGRGVTVANAETVCSIKNWARQPGKLKSRLVSVTAHPVLERHYGLHLSDPRCTDRLDGTGSIQVALPNGKRLSDYPKLNWALSEPFLAANVGKRIVAACTGVVTYSDHSVQFELASDCRIWTED